MPEPRIMKTDLVKPKEKRSPEINRPTPEIDDKIEIIKSSSTKPTTKPKPDIDAEVAKITEHKALPEPAKEKQVSIHDDDFDDDADDLDKIKGDIMKVLSKLDQAEVE